MMRDYVISLTCRNTVSVSFDVGAGKPFALGERLNAVCDMACMLALPWVSR